MFVDFFVFIIVAYFYKYRIHDIPKESPKMESAKITVIVEEHANIAPQDQAVVGQWVNTEI